MIHLGLVSDLVNRLNYTNQSYIGFVDDKSFID